MYLNLSCVVPNIGNGGISGKGKTACHHPGQQQCHHIGQKFVHIIVQEGMM